MPLCFVSFIGKYLAKTLNVETWDDGVEYDSLSNTRTGLPLRRASIGVCPPDPDDCSRGSLDTDKHEIQNDEGSQREPPQNNLDSARVCFVRLPPGHAP
jgi:hypothetical protein